MCLIVILRLGVCEVVWVWYWLLVVNMVLCLLVNISNVLLDLLKFDRYCMFIRLLISIVFNLEVVICVFSLFWCWECVMIFDGICYVECLWLIGCCVGWCLLLWWWFFVCFRGYWLMCGRCCLGWLVWCYCCFLWLEGWCGVWWMGVLMLRWVLILIVVKIWLWFGCWLVW